MRYVGNQATKLTTYQPMIAGYISDPMAALLCRCKYSVDVIHKVNMFVIERK